MCRVGASLVQLSGKAESEAVRAWVKEPEFCPLEVKVHCCSFRGNRLTIGDGELFTMELLMQKAALA